MKTSYYFREKIKVNEWAYADGVICQYWLAEEFKQYIATPEQLGKELLRQGMIDNFDGKRVRVDLTNHVPVNGEHKEEYESVEMGLESYMDSFSQHSWINFLAHYEQHKALQAEIDESVRKTINRFVKPLYC